MTSDQEMTLQKGDFIKLHYTEKVDGAVVATTEEEVAKEKGIFEDDVSYGPMTVLLGMELLIPGLEEDLMGKEVGYSGSVEVPPEKAHGLRHPELVKLIPIKSFTEEHPFPGMRVSVEGQMGRVNRIIGRKVSVDFNHPLADKTVTFDYRILEKIEGLEERIEATIKTFARANLKFQVSDGVVEIDVPWELSYYQGWFTVRRGLADLMIQNLGLEKVVFKEIHTAQRVSAELISPPQPEGSQEVPEKAEGEQAAGTDEAETS